ncbi:DUF5694 domain-containing protein [Maricaulis sp. CAU 1757]
MIIRHTALQHSALAAALLGLACAMTAPAAARQDTAPSAEAGQTLDFDRDVPRPTIDFAGVQRQLGGGATEVLVLGTTHLSQLPEQAFDPAHLSLVLERLEHFAPDIIAIEAIGGRTCDELRRFADIYTGLAEQYCRDPGLALETLGMTQPEAAAAVEEMLATFPDEPTAAERRRFAALLYGAGETWSAALQWSYLTADQRMAGDGVGEALATELDAMQSWRNENQLIGVELARRLDHDLLAAMDDHSADFVYIRSPEEISAVIQRVWATAHPHEAEYDALRPTFLGSPERIRDGYLFLNGEDYQTFSIEKDFAAVAAAEDLDGAARAYLAWWQARGLRMAANVIEAAGNDPGGRVLVIVGASHKAYFEAYLDQMHDIRLVEVESVLGD